MPYYYRKPEPGEVFGSVITFLVIAAIIAAFAFYFGIIVLFVFLGIGAAIGLVYAIIVYAKSFAAACGTLGSVGGYGLVGALAKWWQLFKAASIGAIQESLSVAHGALVRSGGYGALSFKKWMWLIVAPSVLVFGVAMIVIVALAQVALVLAALAVAAVLLAVLAAAYFVVGFVYALITSCGSLGWVFGASLPFSAVSVRLGFGFGEMGAFAGGYFSSLFSAIGTLWSNALSLASSNFNTGKTYPIINIKRYFLLVSPAPIVLVCALTTALAFLFFALAFVPLVIIEFFCALVSLIFARP